MVHILSYEGITIRSYRPHGASVTCIRIDEEDEFVVTSSFEGRRPHPFCAACLQVLRALYQVVW